MNVGKTFLDDSEECHFDVGRQPKEIGSYVDLDPEDLSRVISAPEEPILDIGPIGDFDDAAADFQKVLDGKPDPLTEYGVYLHRGAAQVRRDKLDDAAADFQRAAALKPELYPAYVDLALVYQREKEKGNANRATLAVARKMVAYLLAVDREQRDFVPAEDHRRAAA